ncbi:MAG: 2-hydroxyacid dehydrogenase [Balneolaceae bacterium]|nr:2-hydroxyacid dehydrogenase [Balneolaceae bacterium]MCH8549700.1 2-hydroxyacid dehydrogenase [Balneolaceae bacterium]
MHISLFSAKGYDREFFDEQIGESGHTITYFEDILSTDTLALAEGSDAVCVFVNNPVDRKLLEGLSKMGVRVLALRSAGFNHVDLEAAEDVGIPVFRVPAYSPEAVSEHTMALILTLNRKTHKAYNRVRENNFSLDGLTGFNLHGKTVGVIGTGAIGTAFCRIAAGFGCRILAFDPKPSDETREAGAHFTNPETLFSESNIISLHCPLIPQTRHIINQKSISMMKEDVMLINTSRGALIDTPAVIRALKKKRVGALGIDVYEQEENLFFRDLSGEVIQDDDITRLMSFPNVLITGHQAFLTREALREITRITLNNLTAYEMDKPVQNEIKPKPASES